MNKKQFEEQMLDSCNKVAQMIHEQDLSLTKEQCWEMGKMLYLKSIAKSKILNKKNETLSSGVLFSGKMIQCDDNSRSLFSEYF